ncbi:hypothetical protein CYMTET_41033 [Cymbomonas tetramitiformis]|uniref:Reverse transcriptase domain-containing protein n=1 Tax=Cymbomonas tetramitiformis TaxID=36881 RepID=A0AAE0C7Y9_9CHLO|nr:hypothetical protein CYMTET_41033 [Cymbomonas tetramitiformis]
MENYVSKEHWQAMQAEILKEKAVGNVVRVQQHWKVQGISAVGIVERERKGVVKFRPVWDYSRPEDVGVNSRIDLVKDKFSSVKDAYSLLRPDMWMAKVDLTAAYRSVPEFMWLLHEFVVFLGFKVKPDKCEGPSQALEFLGVLLSTSGGVCTASISEDRMLVVQDKVAEIRRLGALGGPQVPRAKLESLLGLLAFCGQVVYGLSLYTRFAHALLAQCKVRFLHLNDKVIQDPKVICTVMRLYNGRKVRLNRLEVKWEWFSTVASSGVGMGAVLDKRWFAVTWAWPGGLLRFQSK